MGEVHLSVDKARNFLMQTLKISYFDERFVRNKKRVLEEILESWQDKIPFQTVSQLACHDGGMPSLEENVSAIFSLKGGRCWTQNSVLCLLLRALGYDVILVLAHVFELGNRNHVLLIARDLSRPGSRHAVDPTACSPVSLISLDDIQETDEAIQRSVKLLHQDGWIVRCHKHSINRWQVRSTRQPPVQDGEWDIVYYFRVEAINMAVVKETLEQGTGGETLDHVCDNNILLVEFPEGRLTCVDSVWLWREETPGGDQTKIKLETDDDVMNAIHRYFPSVPDDDVTVAVNKRVMSNQK